MSQVISTAVFPVNEKARGNPGLLREELSNCVVLDGGLLHCRGFCWGCASRNGGSFCSSFSFFLS